MTNTQKELNARYFELKRKYDSGILKITDKEMEELENLHGERESEWFKANVNKEGY